ncbi:MAG: phage holin family protein [Oscillospiraceae bacterium]
MLRIIEAVITAVGGVLGYVLGGFDGMLQALLVLVVIDYITGVLCAVSKHELSSSVGFLGISRKVLIFALVGVANIVDIQIISKGSALRTATIFFYMANEAISIIENAGILGLPLPKKLIAVLEQLKNDGKED